MKLDFSWSGVIDRFVCEATRERAVADDRHDRFVTAAEIAGLRHSERAEIDVDACPAPKASYSDSERIANPLRPPGDRIVMILSARPVSILWT